MFVLLPNHLHGILVVETRHPAIAGQVASSLQNRSYTLSNIAGSMKSAVSKQAHENGHDKFLWQVRFYDRIIRNEKELYNIRKYISQNPLTWEYKKNLPENISDL